MDQVLQSFAAFAAYFAAAISLTIIFLVIYIQVTPHNEIKLMREGNAAAALGLAGALFGFVIPLSMVISVSGRLMEAMLWGALALIVQIAAHFVSRMLFPTISADIAAGKFSAAIIQAAMAVALGMLQAACWTP